MKITKFSKLKDNRYKIYLDDGNDMTLYDEVIINYNLLVNKIIDSEKMEELLKYNEELSAYYKALKYINRKIRTKKEISNYLSKVYDDKIIDKTIDKLIEKGYLNDETYIKAYVNDQVNLGNNGPYKIMNNLIKLGFEKDIVLKYINEVDKKIFENKIIKYIEKKIKSNHKYSKNKLKEKIIFELNNLGFEKDMIINNLNMYDIEDPDNILEKEFNKAKLKLEKKYSDKDLEIRIINKLLSKGFKYNEIKEIIEKKISSEY